MLLELGEFELASALLGPRLPMTAVPIPQPPSQSGDSSGSAAPPVAALQDLVASLNRDRHKIQNLLSSLGFALRSFNNLHQFLEIVPLMAARVADADASALVLFEPNGQIQLEQLHCQGGRACQDVRQAILTAARAVKLQSASIPASALGAAIAAEPSSQGQQIFWLADTTRQSFEQEILRGLDPQTRLYGVPVLVNSVERGRLYALSRASDYVWTPMREQLVQLVADQAAVAIANNDLTAELRQKERLDRELEIASDIQLHLLPQTCPKIAGVEIAANCQTANRVGGDYYDFIPANYDRYSASDDAAVASASSQPWSIVIGDVMGKGVPAGLIMTMTRGMLRAEVLNHHAPAQILAHLNRVMYDDLENSHRFVTLFYSSYDPQSRTLAYSNAAHNPPLLWQAASQTLKRLDTNGMLIGLDVDSHYENDCVQLASGDTVLYYTDGFTEAVAPNGERFEEGRLQATFSEVCRQGARPQAILEYIFAHVQNFIGPKNPNGDDMTLVVLQVR